MKYLITGGTGLLGGAVVRSLCAEECDVVILSRAARPDVRLGAGRVRHVVWDARGPGAWCDEMRSSDCVINFAGKSILSSRWTQSVKRELTSSRVDATAVLVQAMRASDTRPRVFISASAVGVYGDRGDTVVTEHTPPGRGFLAGLAVQWEAAAAAAAELGVRVAVPRIGIVLDRDGGALQKMAIPFRLMAGGSLGSGRQMMPWIHLDDLVRAVLFPLGHETFAGPYNCTAPHPVTMKEFCAALGAALHRPCWATVPSFVLKTVLGEASEMLLAGQNALPEKLRTAGFQFHHENIHDALHSIYTT